MARKNEAPQKTAMRDMMSVLLEGVLDEELDKELGYSKYHYKNRDTDNSRNGHSPKTMHISYGYMEVADAGKVTGESGRVADDVVEGVRCSRFFLFKAGE